MDPPFPVPLHAPVKRDTATTRRGFLQAAGTAAAFASAPQTAGRDTGEPSAHLNVLLVLVDDLRPELGCYGSPHVKTPNIDRVAERGMTFLRSYCQQSASNPGRTALLTGLRPDTTRVYDHRVHFRATSPGATTIPAHFRAHGYETTGFGRVFDSPELDDEDSWSIPPWTPGNPAWGSPDNEGLARERWNGARRAGWRVPAARAGSVGSGVAAEPARDRSWWTAEEGDTLPDAQCAAEAAEAIGSMGGSRFLIAVGLQAPRLPLVAPAESIRLYPTGMSDAPQAPDPPRDAPPFALHGSEEIRGFADIPDSGPIPTSKGRELIRAYRACVSFADRQIGVLLDALESNGLSGSTVVAIAGVTGSHLGELGLWGGHSTYEVATHTPLVVRAPGQSNAGRKTSALVESVDLFPSLCALCGLPGRRGMEGSSWRGVFDAPKRLWKRAVFSQQPRAIPGIGPGMGYSMRTARYRYTEWSALDSPYSTAELYDYKESRNEVRNFANRPEHLSLANGLAHMMREGWQGSLPPTQAPRRARG